MPSPLGTLLAARHRIVAFTGAGISTESGIPDFRSPGGVWTRYDPRDFTFDRFVRKADVRRRSWAMRREMVAGLPQPNAAHRALARLEEAGKMLGVVTQNIDGLHQAAGSEQVVELHGTAVEVMCIGAAPRQGMPEGCGFRAPTSWAFERVEAGEGDPRCPACGGLVKSATVSFGQALFPGDLERAERWMVGADLVLAIGSSLQVYPAAALPELAARRGICLVILNDEATSLDGLAALVVRGRAAEVLGPAVEELLAV